MYTLCINICIYTISIATLTVLVNLNAKQKHSRYIKSKAKSEAPVSSYLYMRLKSVISGGGLGPSCLASNNVRSLSEGYINGQHIAMTFIISYA